MQTLKKIDPTIFRAYDIRGIVDENLTIDSVYTIGKAIGSLALSCQQKTIAVARDGRLSGPVLLNALCEGLLDTGCDVIDMGDVPTPLLYFATEVTNAQSGVMLTGSHNPKNYNGLKIVVGKKTLSGDDIQQLYHLIEQQQFENGRGQLSYRDIVPDYIKHICEQVTFNKKLKIVIDSGNGIAGKVAPLLFKQLGCEVDSLYCDVDGHFPHHHPDPSILSNLSDLIHRVKEISADIGFAFDGDGDRLGIVTNRGKVIFPDRQLMLFAQDILSKNAGGMIIYDVKCSKHLEAMIKKSGGTPLMWKTGHSLMKAKLEETKALMAGEMSGHMFFNDRWFGFDDGLYTGVRLLEILSRDARDCHTIFSEIPESVSTPELQLKISEDKKFSLMQALIERANFDNAEIMTIDGMRVNFEKGWGLIRPSNTTPCLVLRFEADDEFHLEMIKEKFRRHILSINDSLVLPF